MASSVLQSPMPKNIHAGGASASLEAEWEPLQTAHNGTLATSIYAEYTIHSNTFIMASSDRRIKTNIEDVPDSLALQQVNDIPCRYYSYIDKSRGNGKTIGFIAQEVEKILPMAVNKSNNTVPDVYKILANLTWNETIIDNTTKYKMSCELDNVNDTKYRFIYAMI